MLTASYFSRDKLYQLAAIALLILFTVFALGMIKEI
jgi:hypothetical protein